MWMPACIALQPAGEDAVLAELLLGRANAETASAVSSAAIFSWSLVVDGFWQGTMLLEHFNGLMDLAIQSLRRVKKHEQL